ncbi:TetR family transcriptional regulator [Jatrophihabitans telluris]|uniref:TetR family transcriptional regulator n=1 Tax=Jatrophihabitans telluris TaxID=2038343 RepID=A0ABY4QWQ6_9ACTN|nr:TetR family transcriptional regulator [Jatrophihabitans telluris]UQX87677.1 TetR family transcriptional regulator [Jatrophihabitans telluris]
MNAKSEATRQRIVAAAMSLFIEQGYQATTMRAIAAEAEVSLGNAYYYFASKQHLVHGFYDELQRSHELAAEAALAEVTGFAERLQVSLSVWFAAAAPYREFALQFFKEAADPESPLSPLSAESAPIRERAVAQFARVVEGSDLAVDPRLRPVLPELLWLVHMGLVLFWIHDRSPDSERTRLLVERGAGVLERMLRLSRLRLLRSATTDVLDLVERAGLRVGATTPRSPRRPPPPR